MDNWLEIVVRQMMLYSLPTLISLTLVVAMESWWLKQSLPHPFYAIASRHVWLPFLASICFTRGIIIAMPNPLAGGVHSALSRLIVHVILCIAGFLLYALMLQHQSPAGLPPLHHWWAKVLMYFNLCMIGLHLLPLPQLLVGELIAVYLNQRAPHSTLNLTFHWLKQSTYGPWVITFIAATSLLDRGLGQLVFPVYEKLATLAAQL